MYGFPIVKFVELVFCSTNQRSIQQACLVEFSWQKYVVKRTVLGFKSVFLFFSSSLKDMRKMLKSSQMHGQLLQAKCSCSGTLRMLPGWQPATIKERCVLVHSSSAVFSTNTWNRKVQDTNPMALADADVPYFDTGYNL